jgi:hypothetical protein
MENHDVLDLGARLGRAQAFGIIATQCSAAQAAGLRQLRESGSYKSLGLNWDDFCRDQVGLTRPRVDAIIRSLEEFGTPYFRLGEIGDISPETYRQLAPAVTGDTIEIDGEFVPLTPENTPRIRHAVQRLRADLANARKRPAKPPIVRLRNRFSAFAIELDKAASDILPSEATALADVLHSCITRLEQIQRGLPGPLEI